MKPKTRRHFLKVAALGATAAAVLPAAPADAAAAGPAKPEGLITRMSRTLGELVQQKFATHELGPQMKEIEQDIVSNLSSAQALRGVPLENGDEPDFVFVPE